MMKDENGIEILKDLGHLCNQLFINTMLNTTQNFPTPKPDGAYDFFAFEIQPYSWIVEAPKYKQYFLCRGDPETGKLYQRQCK